MNTKKIEISSLLEDPKNTGSSEAQIGLLTNKIINLSIILKIIRKTNILHLAL